MGNRESFILDKSKIIMEVVKMVESSKMRIISEEEIPVKVARRSAEWIDLFKKIPKGKAWETSEEELKVTASSVKLMVKRLIDRGLLPDSYHVIQRTKPDGKKIIYIANSAK